MNNEFFAKSRGKFLSLVLIAVTCVVLGCKPNDEPTKVVNGINLTPPTVITNPSNDLLAKKLKGEQIFFESTRAEPTINSPVNPEKDAIGYNHRNLYSMFVTGIKTTDDFGGESIVELTKLTNGDYKDLGLEGVLHAINPATSSSDLDSDGRVYFNITPAVLGLNYYLGSMDKDGGNRQLIGQFMFNPFVSSDGTKLGYHAIRGGKSRIVTREIFGNGELGPEDIFESKYRQNNGSFVEKDGKLKIVSMGHFKGIEKNWFVNQEVDAHRIIEIDHETRGVGILARDPAINSRIAASLNGKIAYHSKYNSLVEIGTNGAGNRVLIEDLKRPRTPFLGFTPTIEYLANDVIKFAGFRESSGEKSNTDLSAMMITNNDLSPIGFDTYMVPLTEYSGTDL